MIQNEFLQYIRINQGTKPWINRVEEEMQSTGDQNLLKGLAYGIFVNSEIERGRIKQIECTSAFKIKGILNIVSHLNRPGQPAPQQKEKYTETGYQTDWAELFRDDEIRFHQQPVALVIADNFENALKAASLVKVQYHKAASNSFINNQHFPDPTDANQIPGQNELSEVIIRAKYEADFDLDSAFEIHGAVVTWTLTNEITEIYRQHALRIIRKDIITSFDIREENLKTHFSFTGPGYIETEGLLMHEIAAVLGAKHTGRPLIVLASSRHLSAIAGQGRHLRQDITVGAKMSGIINYIIQSSLTSKYNDKNIPDSLIHDISGLYSQVCNCPGTNKRSLSKTTSIPRNGSFKDIESFCIESIVDELAYALGIDPFEIRIKNIVHKESASVVSNAFEQLKSCYTTGQHIFEWDKRRQLPGSTRYGDYLIGMGMSVGTGIYNCAGSFATATYSSEGRLQIKCITDGTIKTSEILKNIAASSLGIKLPAIQIITDEIFSDTNENVRSVLLVETCAIVGKLVQSLRQKLIHLIGLANNVGSSVGVDKKDFYFPDHALPAVTATCENNYSGGKGVFVKSYCIHFVEVSVHVLTRTIKVRKVLTAIDAGKIVNLKSAATEVHRSTIKNIQNSLSIGGHSKFCQATSRGKAQLNIQADNPIVEIVFVNQSYDGPSNPTAKKITEIEYTGLSAAIANAVYHATGERVRSLPIRLN